MVPWKKIECRFILWTLQVFTDFLEWLNEVELGGSGLMRVDGWSFHFRGAKDLYEQVEAGRSGTHVECQMGGSYTLLWTDEALWKGHFLLIDFDIKIGPNDLRFNWCKVQWNRYDYWKNLRCEFLVCLNWHVLLNLWSKLRKQKTYGDYEHWRFYKWCDECWVVSQQLLGSWNPGRPKPGRWGELTEISDQISKWQE